MGFLYLVIAFVLFLSIYIQAKHTAKKSEPNEVENDDVQDDN